MFKDCDEDMQQLLFMKIALSWIESLKRIYHEGTTDPLPDDGFIDLIAYAHLYKKLHDKMKQPVIDFRPLGPMPGEFKRCICVDDTTIGQCLMRYTNHLINECGLGSLEDLLKHVEEDNQYATLKNIDSDERK